jgi:hypothetical protein
MKTFKRFSISSVFLLVSMFVTLNAQIPNTMFFMPGVPQSNRINPAIQPGCGFYLGFPALAPVRLQVNSSSLAFSDVIYYNSEIDSLITPMHRLGDKDAFLDELDDVNFLLSSFGTSLGSFGFRAGKSFFSIDLTARMDGNIYYPKGMFELLFNGAPDGSEISLGGIGADINVFNEFSLGWSRKDFLLPNLDIGIRGKALFGLANLSTMNSSFDLSTSLDAWNVNSRMQINAAAPSFVTFNDDFESEDGPVAFDGDFFNTAPPVEIVKSLISPDRFGLALDAGINYRIFPQLQLSASVLDIGGINWKNTVEGSFNFEYDYSMGIEVNPITGVDTAFISELTDSLMNSLQFSTGDPYFSRLNPKLFVGISYYPIEKIGFGLLSRTDFLNESISQQFTGTVNMTTGKFINLSMSYSYISNTFNNIGAGLSFNVGIFNMYLISDNIISGALMPLTTRSVNLWFGMNLTFGWKRAERLAKQIDRPMIRSQTMTF